METLKLKDLSFEAMCAIIAQVVQEANRQYVEAIGGRAVNPGWEQLPEEQKQSLTKAVCETIHCPKTLEESHDAWREAKKEQGYTLGVRIDHIRKTHTNLVRFNELPFEEQLKDALFLGITSIFASALDLCGSTPEAIKEIDEINEYTDNDAIDPDLLDKPVTIGEAAEAAQEQLDNIPIDQDPKGFIPPGEGDGTPIGDIDPDKLQDQEGAAEALTNGVGDRKNPELPLSDEFSQFEADMDAKAAEDTKLAVAPDEDPAPTVRKRSSAKAKKAKKK